MTQQQAMQKINEILSGWQDRNRVWIHLHGKAGAGKEWLIRALLQTHLAEYPLLLRHNFVIFPWRSRRAFREALIAIFQRFPSESERFLSALPGRLHQMIVRLLAEDAPAGSPGDAWEFPALRQFLAGLGRERPAILVAQRLFEAPTPWSRELLKLLENSPELPLLILSSGGKEAPLQNYRLHNVQVEKLSVREAEALVAEHLATHPVNARLITNHLYLKSRGNARAIKWMLEAFYRPLLPGNPQELLEAAVLQKISPAAAPEILFPRLLRSLPEAALKVLALISRLEDPFPEDLLLKTLPACGCGEADLHAWVNNAWLRREFCAGKSFIYLENDTWKDFLRKHTPIDRAGKILELLEPYLERYPWPYPVELSTHLFNYGKLAAALKAARREALAFVRFGQPQRALERYAFLRRNLARHPRSPLRLPEILQEMGELQRQTGLYENAFESFRELRDRLNRSQRREWVEASLQMADTLFRMDALSETRYLLKELKTKADIAPETQFFSRMLAGELEQNSGHADYARQHYESALPLLPQINNLQLVRRLYVSLRELYRSEGEQASAASSDEKSLQLLDLILSALPEDSPERFFYQLERLKYLAARHDFVAALPLARALYRRGGQLTSPAMLAQAGMYLAEIYGYYGKWWLSRSHLIALLQQELLISSPAARLRVIINLGIVEKELGRYGAALECFEEAQEAMRAPGLAGQEHHVKLHAGHTHLLVYGTIRAQEYLSAALAWAEEQQDAELLIPARLFMASYEMQQNRLNSAAEYLQQAKTAIDAGGAPIDRLNYYYYAVFYHLRAGNLGEAAALLESWEQEGRGIVKFENLWHWLSGKMLTEQGDYGAAQSRLQSALERSRRCRLPHLEYQTLRDLALLAKRRGASAALQQYAAEARGAFQRLLETLGDEILQRQLQESREYEELLKLGGE